MRYRKKIGIVLGILMFIGGCGDGSLLEWMGDDNSPAARRAAAQRALDKADCNTAVNLFSGLFDEDSENIDRRLDLAAAYLCQAGFSVQGLLGIVADFAKDKEGTKGTLMQKITAQVAAVIPDEKIWKANICKSKDLLGDIKIDSTPDKWPCASETVGQKIVVENNDPDAGYILTIVNLADATLAIADALNTINGVARCFVENGTSTCTITPDDLTSVANALLAAAQSAQAAGPGGDLFQTADNLVFNADTNQDKALSNQEILDYLVAQKIIDPNNLNTVPPNCQFIQGTLSCT